MNIDLRDIYRIGIGIWVPVILFLIIFLILTFSGFKKHIDGLIISSLFIMVFAVLPFLSSALITTKNIDTTVDKIQISITEFSDKYHEIKNQKETCSIYEIESLNSEIKKFNCDLGKVKDVFSTENHRLYVNKDFLEILDNTNYFELIE